MTSTFEELITSKHDEEFHFIITSEDVLDTTSGEPSLFKNPTLKRRLLHYASHVKKVNRPASFFTILWDKSTSAAVKYKNYNFSLNQDGEVHLQVTHTLTGKPKDLALLQNSEIVELIHEVILISEAEPIEEPGPRIIYVNSVFEKMTGYSQEEVFGKNPRILQGEKTSPESLTKIREALKQWSPVSVELLNYTKDKKEFYVELSITPRKDEAGWFTHWISVQRDVTLRKIQDRQFQHSSKLAFIGELASSVGHEVNNPATIIGGLLYLTELSLRQSGLNDKEIFQNFESMNLALKRIYVITKSLRTYARTEDEEIKVFSVSDLTKETFHMLKSIYHSKGIELQLITDEAPYLVNGNRGKLQQILMNLISNAKDATEGKLERKIQVELKKELNSVVIFVRDNGTGIPSNIQEKIFDPFFTTKPANHGTGLGLPLVKSFVNELSGEISLNPNYVNGTEFKITLPMA